MADRIDDLTGHVQTLEEKLDRRFEQVDRRFDAVDAAIVEQRQYTEFASSRLEAKMDAGFTRVGERFDRLERKLDQFIDLHV